MEKLLPRPLNKKQSSLQSQKKYPSASPSQSNQGAQQSEDQQEDISNGSVSLKNKKSNEALSESPTMIKRTKRPTELSSQVIVQCLYSYIKKIKVVPTALCDELQIRYRKYSATEENVYYPFYPDTNFEVTMREPRQSIKELQKYLETMESMQTYEKIEETDVQWSEELHRAAMKRAESIEKGSLKGQSMDVGELVNEFGYWRVFLSEIIVYGFFDPKEILVEAFLEDGSFPKKNRQEFFHEKGKYLGIGIAEHPKYRFVIVIIFAGDIRKPVQIFGTERSTERSTCDCSIY